jgi:ligand-binding sensor domain-containing protein/DNA-binding CsgD family transcriptional regulator
MICMPPGKSLLNLIYHDQARKHKPVSGIAILLFFWFFFPAAAQETPPLANYPFSAYKAHNQNWAIDQSRDRMIYVANSDGLMEYDGASWKVYEMPDRQIVRSVVCDEFAGSGSIPDDKFVSRTESIRNKTEHRIYVGGYAEFGYWRKDPDGQLSYHSLSKDANLLSLKTEEIWHIVKTPHYIYFQSFSRIYRYDGKKLIEIKASGNFMFLQYVHNRLLLQIIGKGLYELKDQKFVALPGTDKLSSSTVSSILSFSKNRILITTAKHGLYIWDNGFLTPWSIDLSEELKRNIINRAIVLSQDSSIVLGTIQKGIYVISKNGTLKYQFNRENGLQNNTVLALTEDSRKHVWIGMDQGIDLIKMSSPVISYQTNDNPLGTVYAAAIWKGDLYIGSNNGVFIKKWLVNEPFRAIPGLGGQTWNLQVYNDQLICGHNDATFRIEKNGIQKISDVTGGWAMQPVKVGNDTFLLQGAYNGLHIYKRNTHRLWSYAYAVKGAPPLPFRRIVRDNNGTFWLEHAYKGLFLARLTPQMDSVLYWKEFRAPADIPGEFSVEIARWENNVLVHSGSSFLKATEGNILKPIPYFSSDNDEPFKIRSGENGDWFKIFTNRIILNPNKKNAQIFDFSLVRNSETIIPLSREYYLFCLDNGYALYNRSKTERIQEPPAKPLIRKIANLRNSSEIFTLTEKPSLPPDIRSIRIMYAVPVFGQSFQYKYRLKGLSDQWSEWSDQNFVEFTNLESTDYVFEIRSSLNSEVTAYKFSILPYWHETVYAKILFALLFAMFFVGLIFYQEKRLVRHRKKLLEEQEEKLRQQRLASERQIMQIQNEKLHTEIQSKSQQLSNVAINVVRKNEILEEIRDELKQVKEEMGQQLPNIHYQKLLKSIERNVAGKDDWILFEQNFDEIHEHFFKRLRTVNHSISPSELRLAACLRMNLSTKEMAPVLGISIRGVEIKRYRLRKKLGIGVDANLVQYMMDV